MSRNRYEKIVLEADKGINFKVSEGTRGELIITALNRFTESVISENYVNPPIPKGYIHVEGEWNNGYVIQRCSDESQFVWIPVGSLDSDGTLDGEHFSEKFGRRNYRNDEFSDTRFHEELNDELREQIKSIKKYGGFYISRYNISDDLKSIKGAMPCVNCNYKAVKEAASAIEDSETIKSHLTYGAEYDSVLAWLIKSGAKTLKEIAVDSTMWGNHWNTDYNVKEVAKTGSREEWCVNNIYDLAGNVDEWTQERYGKSKKNRVVIRGGYSFREGNEFPVAYRCYSATNYGYENTGFRVTLCIK